MCHQLRVAELKHLVPPGINSGFPPGVVEGHVVSLIEYLKYHMRLGNT